MILFDTNVVSEPWKPAPDMRVLAWIDAQAIDTLYLSAIPVAELRFGIAAMPAGKRRSTLDDRLRTDVLPLFENRILPFDLDASKSPAHGQHETTATIESQNAPSTETLRTRNGADL